MSASMKKNLIGILVDGVDRASALERIVAAAHERRPYTVSALAVHGVMEGVLDEAHRYRLNHLDLVVPDGQPVRWALNLIHALALRQRVNGPALTREVLRRAAEERLPVYLYGTTPDILDRLCAALQQLYPKLQIAGATPSCFGRLSPQAADQLTDRIKSSGARIVFAGLGCPRQEVWAYEFRDRLKMPILAVGAAFPFIAGTLRQAPVWMQDRGLEWLFRLSREPRRLWQRYLVLGPAYVLLVGCQALGIRFQVGGTPPQQEILFG